MAIRIKHSSKTYSLPAYDVIYSKRKTIGLQIERDTRLVVRAPFGVTPERIEQIVASKSLWVYTKIHRTPKQHTKPPQKERLNGETMPYLGRYYHLTFKNSSDGAFSFQFCGKFLLTNAETVDLREIFQSWYEERGRMWIPKRVKHFGHLMGAEPKDVTVSNATASWGSCSPGGILNFNWRLMQAPSRVVDYVVIHELTHLLEPNHTPRFWNIIAIQQPDYKASREWLAKHGAELEREF